jgi:hypothetical protein
MGYVEGYEWDIFISYPHEANERGVDDLGWVTQFHKHLKQEIDLRTDRDVKIYFDNKHFAGNQSVEKDLLEAARNSYLFLPILSPRYIASNKFTLRELNEFCSVGNIAGRIFVIDLLPVPRMKRPEALRSLKENKFYKGEGDRTAQLDPPEYIVDLRYLTGDIKRQLEPAPKTVPGKTVWLAEKEDDINAEWQQIREYLEDTLHLSVLPHKCYPLDDMGLRAAVEADLARSDVFIQLLSPQDEADYINQHPNQPSRAQLQSDAATRECKKRGNRLLQWRKPAKPDAFKSWNKALQRSRTRSSSASRSWKTSKPPLPENPAIPLGRSRKRPCLSMRNAVTRLSLMICFGVCLTLSAATRCGRRNARLMKARPRRWKLISTRNWRTAMHFGSFTDIRFRPGSASN